jgi:hypothetical protein
MEFTCNLCNHRIDKEGICARCHNRLHSQLDDLVEFWKAAHEELLPGRTGSGGRSSERTIGLNVNALSFIAGHDIIGMLHEWEKIIREDRDLVRPANINKRTLTDEITKSIAFAQKHLAWSATQPWIADFASELRALHSQGMAAARQFVDRPRKIACPAELPEGGNCGQFLNINHDDPLDIFECRKCRSEWTTLRLVAVALSDPNRKVWLDAEAIGKWMGISDRHVRRIAAQNGVSKKGQLYDVKAFQMAYKNNA